MWKKILMILSVAIGGFMVSVTSDNLGEQGNKIMHLVGILLMIGGIIAVFKTNKKN
ncbi:hypothetical protein C7437_1216 [Psychrobacillus insolitus]|uniref:Gram-positive cocci surface proteins LPxTG domain-containing protein n=1 Tax=Psychrobacillus insolitus TaxID=1461 RepID=A0A2W7M9J2_9BACI|nr:LPXTG cell wall anchor domain-containing protein [Psychrobacillus insolitus]PZX01220.1 hypothetical protein C7437_1216 [Psychrobacillus insolitus]